MGPSQDIKPLLVRRGTMKMRIFLLVLLCAAVACFNESVDELPEAFIEESGPWVPPAAGWEGADACARRFENVVVKSWKKVKGKQVKRMKQCEVKVKGPKWNKIRGFCRGALRFCALYKKFAKHYNAPSLLYAAKPHCRKAAKLHAKLWKASRNAERKARQAKRRKLRACMKNKRCRRAHFRHMRRAEHSFPPVSVGRWRGYVAKHRKCMRSPKCRKKYLARRTESFRNGHRAARRCEYQRCMKNKTCRRRYLRFKRGHRARKKARKGKKAPKGKKKARKGKKKARKGKKKARKGKKGAKKPKAAKKAAKKGGKKASKKASKKGGKKAGKKAKKAADFVSTNMFNF